MKKLEKKEFEYMMGRIMLNQILSIGRKYYEQKEKEKKKAPAKQD